MRRNTATINEGCLLEIRADRGYVTAADADDLFDQIRVAVFKLPRPGRHFTVVDWTQCPIMTPVAATRTAQNIVAAGTLTVRSAGLARSDSPDDVLQFLRLIREAGNPNRRLFFDAEQLIHWLAEVLSERETVRLRAFLKRG